MLSDILSSHFLHGFSIVLSVFFGGCFSYILASKEKFKLTGLPDYLVVSLVFGAFGARLFYYIAYKNQFIDFWEIFRVWEGGLVSYGGFIIGGAALAFSLWYSKKPVLRWLDYLSCGFLLGLAVGRFGDVLTGEYMGFLEIKEISIAVTFAEASWGLILLALIMFFRNYLKKIIGLTFSITVLLYSGGRFFIDFGRYDNVAGSLSMGQTLSLIVFILSIIFLNFVILFSKRRIHGIR